MQVLQGMILYLENLHNTSRGEIGGSDKAARGVEDAAPYTPPYGSRRGRTLFARKLDVATHFRKSYS